MHEGDGARADRGAVDRRSGPDAARERRDFLLAIAADEREAVVVDRRDEPRRGRRRAGERDQLDVGQRVEEPRQVARFEDGFGGDDRERLEPGETRQEIVIGGPQPVGRRGDVGHRDHDRRQRAGRRVERDGPRAQAVLVDEPRRVEGGLVAAKRRREEARLVEEPRRPAIERGAALERGADQPLEVVDRAAVAAQRVVELEHRGHEGRPQREGRLRAGLGDLPRHRAGHHLARDRIDARDAGERFGDEAVEAGARDQVRQRHRARRRRGLHGPVERAERVAVGVARHPALDEGRDPRWCGAGRRRRRSSARRRRRGGPGMATRRPRQERSPAGSVRDRERARGASGAA